MKQLFEALHRHFEFDEAQEELVWKEPRSNRVKKGSLVGSDNGHGYIHCGFYGRDCMLHHLVWVFFHGEWPLHEIDHIDRDPTNNSIHNLRLCDRISNMLNQNTYTTNKSTGVKGVYFDDRCHLPYQVQIQYNNVKVICERFATFEEACDVAKKTYANIKEIDDERRSFGDAGRNNVHA